jgi:hypothetical protein
MLKELRQVKLSLSRMFFLNVNAVKGASRDPPLCLQRWRERGVRLIAFTVNNSIERAYLERCLRVSCVADSMDEIPIESVVKEA